MKVGVLALQGDFREHLKSVAECGVEGVMVRRASEIESVDALIIPGGESTTIIQLAEVFDVYEVIKRRILNGMPTYGSCAGMILLADEILDSKKEQKSFGGLNISVRRNAFGSQVDSFETDIEFKDGQNELLRAVFIRAPWVERVGDGVEILAQVNEHVVAVRSKNVLATAFHPELTGGKRVHSYFIDQVARPAILKVGLPRSF